MRFFLVTVAINCIYSWQLFGVPKISSESSNEEIARFYSSLPDNTFSKHIVYYFDLNNKKNYNFFSYDEKNHENNIEIANLLDDEISKVRFIFKLIQGDIIKIKTLLNSENVVLIDYPLLVNVDGKYKIPEKTPADENQFRICIGALIKIKYTPIKKDNIEEYMNKLDKFGLTDLGDAVDEVCSKFKAYENNILDFTRKYADIFYALATSQSDLLLNSITHYNFLCEFFASSNESINLIEESINTISKNEKNIKKIEGFEKSDLESEMEFDISAYEYLREFTVNKVSLR